MTDSHSEGTPLLDTSNANCRELLDVLTGQGVDTIVLSPGSRNAPLLIGAAARSELRKLVINDERTAAFTALGISLASQRPVALACTSGTSLYNYAPAVAEAFYQHVPLIVITADRPAQWIDQDDSQTLHQFGALDKIVKKSFDIYAETGMTTPCSNPGFKTEREWFVNRVANEAVLTALEGVHGPVHINMQFANPLNETVPYRKGTPRLITNVEGERRLTPERLESVAAELMQKKVMVVAGFMEPDNRLNRALARFATMPNVAVLAETISNLHLGDSPYSIDALLARVDERMRERLRPDVVISLGGSLVSRMLKEYLRSSCCAEHWTLADTPLSSDCMQRRTLHLDVSPAKFFSGVTGAMNKMMKKGELPRRVAYSQEWRMARMLAAQRNREIISGSSWSELKALDKLFGTLPSNFSLFLSNGTSVRYAQLLIDKLPHTCFSNRGVSGIDGTNATAFGVSLANNRPTLLVTGDMSFAYCPEILNLKRLGGDLRIVVVNNSGGGIFRFIKTTRALEIRESYFCSAPQLPLQKLAEAYGWNYCRAANETELNASLRTLWSTESTLLEIAVDPESSAEALINYMES